MAAGEPQRDTDRQIMEMALSALGGIHSKQSLRKVIAATIANKLTRELGQTVVSQLAASGAAGQQQPIPAAV